MSKKKSHSDGYRFLNCQKVKNFANLIFLYNFALEKNTLLIVKKTAFLLILLLCVLQTVNAQTQDTTKTNGRKIEIVNSNTLEVDEYHGADVKVLKGDVQFYHDSASMFFELSKS